ncbi:MAG: AMP-binding protein [Actinobacteria bacterium]|nr:AMP-binding protein [Actinomycetota bacterium]
MPNGRRLTFGALHDRAQRLAWGLREELGLEKGDRVAILSTNAAEIAETFFACAKAGLVAQPLNWRLAPAEQARILADAEPAVLLWNREFAAEIAEIQRLHDLERWIDFAPGNESPYEELLVRQPELEPPWRDDVGDHDPFFILYTGGTTGVSKGALHSHATTAAAMVNQTVGERVAAGDVYMLLGQMFHIPVVLAMTYTAHGRPVVLTNFEPRQTLEVIEAERVSGFLGITTMLNYLLAVPDFDRFDLSSLRLIVYGGGPMPEAVVRQIMERFPCDLMQGYGQTEGCTMTFLHPWVHEEIARGDGTHRAASCGQEAFLSTVAVFDEEGRPVPRDRSTVGEIVVRSPANMVGYWRQPELTAQVFRDGGGWMRTGDVARWDEDGFVYIVDRAKDMVISGGENIYPAQVEACIYRHPAVLECAVFGVPDETWGEALKAVVVVKPGMALHEEEIVELTRRELASYMKPKTVEFVDALPKGPTGKILKRELRDPWWEGRERRV